MNGKMILGFSVLGLMSILAVALVPLALCWSLSQLFATEVCPATWAGSLVIILILAGHGLLAGRKR